MTTPPRIVFDCNIYFQAAISLTGPARRLLQKAIDGELTLFISDYVIAELTKLMNDPRVRAKYHLSDKKVDDFLDLVRTSTTFVPTPPSVFVYPRDPKDAHYVDLALAASAKLIVSRDKDLLSLRDSSTPEGRDFQTRFPQLEVLTPPEMLARLPAAP